MIILIIKVFYSRPGNMAALSKQRNSFNVQANTLSCLSRIAAQWLISSSLNVPCSGDSGANKTSSLHGMVSNIQAY